MDKLLCGMRHPRQILRGVHQGVKDGGNKSVVYQPSMKGISFDDSLSTGKLLALVVVIGVLPQNINGKPTFKKEINLET